MKKKLIKFPSLSVIVPVYNETDRLTDNLKKISAYLKKQSYTTELIVINDGSTDDTKQKLDLLKKTIQFTVVSYPKNRGKGYAVKTGMLEATGKFRLFTDIDLSVPTHDFDTIISHCKKFDVVVASRRTPGSRVEIHQSLIRESMGRMFTALSRFVLQTPVSDFTCGCKCFSAESAQYIFSRSIVKRWGFDSEALYLATRKRFTIKEVPVTWKNDTRTKVVFPRDLIRSLGDLLLIRFYPYRL